MALDQNLTPAPTETETVQHSAIENELPAYRAITPLAVVSLICGILAVLTFASWYFLVFPGAAIALGILADRRIKRDPEIWTGKGFASAGIALGLAFGLSAVTISVVQDMLNRRAAASFARQYVEVLKTRPLEEAIYYQLSPLSREGKQPAELYKELKSQPDPSGMEMRFGGVIKLKDRLNAGTNQDLHFAKLETAGFDGITPYGAALLEVHGPASKDFPEEQHAMILVKSMNHKGKQEWWVEEAKFPYEPSSFVPAAKPVDDGHGHAH